MGEIWCILVGYFNSIKVQLRLITFISIQHSSYYFNSIKVQLRPIVTTDTTHVQQFQFHKGTIKTYPNRTCRSRQTHFNSIKVQLRRGVGGAAAHPLRHFNSIKVQLRRCGRKPVNRKRLYFNSIKVQLRLASCGLRAWQS